MILFLKDFQGPGFFELFLSFLKPFLVVVLLLLLIGIGFLKGFKQQRALLLFPFLVSLLTSDYGRRETIIERFADYLIILLSPFFFSVFYFFLFLRPLLVLAPYSSLVGGRLLPYYHLFDLSWVHAFVFLQLELLLLLPDVGVDVDL